MGEWISEGAIAISGILFDHRKECIILTNMNEPLKNYSKVKKKTSQERPCTTS